MPRIYSNDSLAKHNWLWRYDTRRKRGCSYNGHRFKWLIERTKENVFYFGLCRHCSKPTIYSLLLDQLGRAVQVKKIYHALKIQTITTEQFKRLRAKAIAPVWVHPEALE